MKRRVIAISIALTSNLVASPAFAACALTPESSHTIIRGRFVRCEDASFYLEAAGAYQRYEQDLAAAISRVGPENSDVLLERLGESRQLPFNPDFQARVAVVAIDLHALIVPWSREAPDTVEFKDQPRPINETVRYWWRGSIDACESIAQWAPVDLWVYSECCDMPEFEAPVCIIDMDYAEPAPGAMSDALSQVVGGV